MDTVPDAEYRAEYHALRAGAAICDQCRAEARVLLLRQAIVSAGRMGDTRPLYLTLCGHHFRNAEILLLTTHWWVIASTIDDTPAPKGRTTR